MTKRLQPSLPCIPMYIVSHSSPTLLLKQTDCFESEHMTLLETSPKNRDWWGESSNKTFSYSWSTFRHSFCPKKLRVGRLDPEDDLKTFLSTMGALYGFMEFWSPGWYSFLPRFLEGPVVDAHLQLCRVFGPWPKWEAQPADVGWDGWMDVGRDPMKTWRNLVWILDVGSNSFNVFSLQSAVGLLCLFFFMFFLLLLFVVVCSVFGCLWVPRFHQTLRNSRVVICCSTPIPIAWRGTWCRDFFWAVCSRCGWHWKPKLKCTVRGRYRRSSLFCRGWERRTGVNDYEVGRLFVINCTGITFHLL